MGRVYKPRSYPSIEGGSTKWITGELARIATALDTFTDVPADLTAIEADIEALETDVSAAEADIEALETDVSAAEADITSLETRVTVLEGSYTTVSSGSHTVVSGDNGKTLKVTGSAQTTITLPAASGFTAPFWIEVVNDMADRRTDVAVSGGTTRRLYPKQNIRVEKEGSNWVVKNAPGPWLIDQDRTIFVSDASGSTSNDGLHSSSPLPTQYAFDLVIKDIDCGSGYHVTFQASGALDDGLSFVQPIRGAIYATLQGDITNRASVTLPVGSAQIGIYVKHRGFLKIRSITFSGASATALVMCDRNGGVDLYDCEFGTATNASCVVAVYNGSVEFAGVCYFSGSCVAVVYADHGGKIIMASFTHEILANMTVSVAFALALNGGDIGADPGGGFNLHSYTVTGERILAAAMGIIRSGNNTTTFYPGTAYTAPTSGFYL